MDGSFTSGSFGELVVGFSHFHDYKELPYEGSGNCKLYTVISGERKLILKAANKEKGSLTENIARLQREYKLLERLYGNEHIVRCIGWREDVEVGPCIVMEYIDGETLTDYLKGAPSSKEKKRILNELLDAVGFIHKQQIVHNDLKTDNILITRNGHNVKLIDFGYADSDSNIDKATGGTKAFAAPELAKREGANVTSDIYSLGFIIKALFPHQYTCITSKCLREKSSRRYQNANEVRQALYLRDVCGRWLPVMLLAIPLLVWLLFQTLDQKPVESQQQTEKETVDSIQIPKKTVDTVFIVQKRHDTVKVEAKPTPAPTQPEEIVKVQLPASYKVTPKEIDSMGQSYLDVYKRAEPKMSQQSLSPQLGNNGKWGYVDKDGKYVVEPKYELAGDFSEDRAIVMENGLYGYIDEKGVLVIPTIYQAAKVFKNGYAPCCLDGKYGLVAKDGSQYLFSDKGYYTNITLSYSGLFYEGHKKASSRCYVITFNPLPVESEYDDLSPVLYDFEMRQVKRRGLYGYLGRDGNLLGAIEFKADLTFNNQGFAVAKTENGNGIVNSCMEHVTELNHPFAKKVKGGFLYGYETRFGAVTDDGNISIKKGTYAHTEFLDDFSMILARMEDGTYTIVGIDGMTIVPKSESITVSEGIAIIKNGKETEFLDLSLLKKRR